MKKIFKKNQIIITALALMIAVAGYIQYTDAGISDEMAQQTSGGLTEDTYEISDEDVFQVEDIFSDTEDNSGTLTETETNEEGQDAQANSEEITNPGEAVLTGAEIMNTDVASLDFAAEVKLNREQVRSKNKETLLEVINNTEISEEQKQDAINEMIALTDIAEREAAAEMLLEAKGFTDVVVSINDSNVDVVLNMGEVTDAKRAQVEDIVKRKTEIAAENIVITPVQTTAETVVNSK